MDTASFSMRFRLQFSKLAGISEAERRQRAAETIFGAASPPSSGIARLGAGAMSAAGSVWGFISNEAAAAEGVPPTVEGSAMQPPPPVSALDVRVALRIMLQGAPPYSSYSI